MVNRRFTGSLAAEMYFWLGVLRDHTQFLLTNLSPAQQEQVKEVLAFRRTYMELYDQIKSESGAPEAVSPELVRDALDTTRQFIQFKNEILQQQLRCEISINQPPTFTQHMINEAEEFVEVLSGRQSRPPQGWLEQHLLWLPDAWGHAAFLAAGLDSREAQLVQVAQEYQKMFEQLHLKAEEVDSMVGEDPERLPLFAGFNQDVIQQVQTFQEFLLYLRDELAECRVLSFLSPLVPDHMAREGQYYLEKIS